MLKPKNGVAQHRGNKVALAEKWFCAPHSVGQSERFPIGLMGCFMRGFFATTILISLLSACAIEPLDINRGVFSSYTPKTALEQDSVGSRVKWGGEIIDVTPAKEKTCFEILSRPLDSDGEPQTVDATDGRFLACSDRFRDPAAYPAGRRITVSGTIRPATVCKIGSYESKCPRMDIEALHLWPKRTYLPTRYYCDPFYCRPYGWPYGPWPGY